MKNLLTINKLKEIEPHSIFANGEGLIIHPWYNNAKNNLVDGRYVKIKWVAVRGEIHDWVIYHSLDANLESSNYLDGFKHLEASNEQIARLGSKLFDKFKIREFVPCDEEVMDMYRFS